MEEVAGLPDQSVRSIEQEGVEDALLATLLRANTQYLSCTHGIYVLLTLRRALVDGLYPALPTARHAPRRLTGKRRLRGLFGGVRGVVREERL